MSKPPHTGTTPFAKEKIDGYISALKSIVKEYNRRGNVSPIRLSFDDVEDRTRDRTVVTGKEIGDAELKRPFKEAVKTLLTWRIIEFASLEFKMPANIKLCDGTTDPEDHFSRFSSAENLEGSIEGWVELNKEGMFQRPNENNQDCEEGQRNPGGFQGKMNRRNRLYHGCFGGHEDIIGGRFCEIKEAFASIEFPNREASATLKKSPGPVSRREDRFHRGGYEADKRRNKGRSAFNNREGLVPYRAQAPYQALRDQGYHHPSRKGRELDKSTHRVSSFVGDVSDEPLIIESVMEGYLVRRVYVDEGASLEVMFKHCFKNLSPAMRSRLMSTQMDLVGFAVRVVKLLGKIELEVVFSGGLFRTLMINFIVIRASSPYNVIFGRTCSSTIHSMIKFPTLRGIANLATRTMVIAGCQRLKKKQMIEKETGQNTLWEEEGPKRVGLTEQALVNPAYLDQLVTIEGNLSEGCKDQLKALLKKSMDVFAWEPSDITGIPRRIIKHPLNVNPSIEPVAQKKELWHPKEPRR
uniref:Reverse transcriptase domain-containing protein n=1 Tax=Tanacetum cinerariifolium TaxID=118510 RepID=A0A699GGZ7_TANCI|nr:reverse transcriptase domain-containing protein [Tanacetum cinerariifolium]